MRLFRRSRRARSPEQAPVVVAPGSGTSTSGASTGRRDLRSLLVDPLGWTALRSGQILLVIALAAIVVWGLIQVKLVVIPVLIALILAAAIGPVVNAMRRRGLSAVLATWIAFLTGIVVIGGVLWIIVIAVRSQWDELTASAVEGFDQLQTFLADGPLPIDQQALDDAQAAVLDFVTSSQFGTGALAGASVATELITGTVLAIVILFFFLKDGDVIWNFFLRPFRGERLERGRRIGHTALAVFGGYVRGTAIIALVDAVAIGVGILLVGVSPALALPLAVIVFATAFIPLVGATAAGVLAALVALVTVGPVQALIVVGIVVLVNQLEGNFLQPVVMAQSLKLHPLVILVALTAGTILGGIVGAVLAVPLAAVAWSIIKVWNGPDPTVTQPQRPLRRFNGSRAVGR